jgi:hypothetical protein
MLNGIIAGVSSFSLAFCVYTAGWGGGPCHEGHHQAFAVKAAAVDSCCDTEAVSAGPDVCTHCEAEANHEGEMKVMLLDAAATGPATAPTAKGTDAGNTKCLISGEAIGSMGEGKAVEYQGKVYHLCCGDCVSTFNKNPEKYVKAFEADPAKWGVKK